MRNIPLFYMIKKELLHVIRDKGLIPIVFIMPVVQLIMFGYVVSTDVKDLSVAIVDYDHGAESRKLIRQVNAVKFFDVHLYPKNEAALKKLILSNKADAGLIFPADFSKDLNRGHEAAMHIVVDGSDPNSGSVSLTYLSGLARQFSIRTIAKTIPPSLQNSVPGVDASIRVWYNASLKSVNFMIPGLIGFILAYITTNLTAAAIVKEKELGTFEQLIVTPLKRHELLLGKMVPFVLVGLFDICVVTLVGVFWFGAPFRGNLALFLIMSMIFLFSTLGLGILASTVSQTQQQAMVTAMFIMIASMLLSGFIFPVENMPVVIQFFSHILPLTHFIFILRSIFLKGLGFYFLWQAALALLVLGGTIFLIALFRFQKRFGE